MLSRRGFKAARLFALTARTLHIPASLFEHFYYQTPMVTLDFNNPIFYGPTRTTSGLQLLGQFLEFIAGQSDAS
jgi:hypothetical protein